MRILRALFEITFTKDESLLHRKCVRCFLSHFCTFCSAIQLTVFAIDSKDRNTTFHNIRDYFRKKTSAKSRFEIQRKFKNHRLRASQESERLIIIFFIQIDIIIGIYN